MIAAASPLWFARHEARLIWRDWLAMMQAGRRGRLRLVLIGVALFWLALHGLALGLLRPYAAMPLTDKPSLLLLTGSGFLAWTLMLSQALESVTRAAYARADLDLILSSPVSVRPVFALRIGAASLLVTAMALVLFGPFIDVMALLAGPRFLAGYGVLLVMGLAAGSLATAATMLMLKLCGPRRTRFVAQVVAAIVGASFAIGVQAAAILTYGSLSRTAMFHSRAWLAAAPGTDHPLWWPARAAMGDGLHLALLLALAALMLAATMMAGGAFFAREAASIASAGLAGRAGRGRIARIMPRSPAATLRRKEWRLLCRDPWLVSQSLMQVLYLLPPALLLWRNFGADVGAIIVVAPVIVMAAGQLAGGLAWLAISGEDAPDLVATAPVGPRQVMRAKVEAVLMAVALPVLPLVLWLAAASPWAGVMTLLHVLLAAGAATAIQIAFRAQARRSQFRRRQTSSRFATFAEAFCSISVAGAAGLAAAGSVVALVPLALAAMIVAAAFRFAPRRAAS